MASRTVAKDIITLRGSAAIVSEFFGMFFPLIWSFKPFSSVTFLYCYLIKFCGVKGVLFFYVCGFLETHFQVMQQTGKKIRSWYLCCFLFSWILLYNLRPWYSNFEWWICLVYFTIVEFIQKKVLWRWRNMGSQCCLLKMRVSSPSLLILLLSFQVLFMPFWRTVWKVQNSNQPFHYL